MRTQYVFFAFLFVLSCGLNSSCTDYYYMVRHAEKLNPSDDNTPLSNDGARRAIALCDSLRNKNVSRIFISDARRSRETAQPTASALNIVPTPYNRSQGLAYLESQVRGTRDHNVLVVGHSDNIPELIHALTGNWVTSTTDHFIPESDFDNFYIIKRERNLGSDVFSIFRTGTYGVSTP